MSVFNDIPLRSARNRLLEIVYSPPADQSDFNTIAPSASVYPYPLRDLPVCYSPGIDLGTTGVVFLLGVEAEEEVVYTLVDDKGSVIAGVHLNLESETDLNSFVSGLKGLNVFANSPLDPSLTEFNAILEELKKPENAGMPDELKSSIAKTLQNKWQRVIRFTTPEISQDKTFFIQAENPPLKVLLDTRIDFRTKIAALAEIKLVDTDTNPVTQVTVFPVTVEKAGRYTIRISGSQNNVHYKLIRITGTDGQGNPTWEERSERYPGNGEDLDIPIPSDAQPEAGAVWGVRASREVNESLIPFEAKIMQARFPLTIGLFPNVDFGFDPNPATRTAQVSYASASERSLPNIRIGRPQKGVTYQLLARKLKAASDYAPDGTLLISKTALLGIDAGTEKATFSMIGQAAVTGELLEEDSLLVVQAEFNGETELLDGELVALVKPDPRLTLGNPPDGNLNFVRLSGAQPGVGYQLREANSPFTEVGPLMVTEASGIGYEAHGRIFGMQINARDVDFPGLPPAGNYFKIEKEEENQSLEFSTTDILPGKVYEVLAVREYTGVAEVLNQKIG